MANSGASALARLPSVDRLLRMPQADALVATYGRAAVTEAIRAVLEDLRAARRIWNTTWKAAGVASAITMSSGCSAR